MSSQPGWTRCWGRAASLDYSGITAPGHHNLFPRVLSAGVKLTAQHFVEEIDGPMVHVYNIWGGPGRVVAEVDTVVLSLLRSPDDALFREIQGRFGEVHRVGDAVAPRKPMAIIHEAEELGRTISPARGG